VAAAPGVERAAHRDVQRRRPGDAGADGRIGSRRQLEPLGPEVVQQLAEQLEIVAVAQLRPVIDFDALAGILGDDDEAAVGPRAQVAAGAQADRRVQRLRAFVEEVERPDVERAAGEIDPCRRRGVDVHGKSYIGDCRLQIADSRIDDWRLPIHGLATVDCHCGLPIGIADCATPIRQSVNRQPAVANRQCDRISRCLFATFGAMSDSSRSSGSTATTFRPRFDRWRASSISAA
jgi:hypothetical protein